VRKGQGSLEAIVITYYQGHGMEITRGCPVADALDSSVGLSRAPPFDTLGRKPIKADGSGALC
jgi:hypothetical protein